jgi:hypothetical protein
MYYIDLDNRCPQIRKNVILCLNFAGSTLLFAAVNKFLSMPIVIKCGKLDQIGWGQGHIKNFNDGAKPNGKYYFRSQFLM